MGSPCSVEALELGTVVAVLEIFMCTFGELEEFCVGRGQLFRDVLERSGNRQVVDDPSQETLERRGFDCDRRNGNGCDRRLGCGLFLRGGPQREREHQSQPEVDPSMVGQRPVVLHGGSIAEAGGSNQPSGQDYQGERRIERIMTGPVYRARQRWAGPCPRSKTPLVSAQLPKP